MQLKEQNILMLTRTMALGGTENVILQLCEILKDKVNKIIVCSAGGINTKKLDEMGIKHYQISDIENKSPINVIKNIKMIKTILANENITIIHSHHRMAALYANLCASKSIIKIANAHNTFTNKKMLTRIAYKNTKIVAVGEQVKKNLVDYYGINEIQVKVIHNAIKPFEGNVTIDAVIGEAKENGYTLVANIGRLSEQKGMEYFIEAAEIINKLNRKIKFFIIGSGEEELKLKKMVNEKKLDGNIVFMGFRQDIQNLMSQVDLIVLSSLWEGLPLTPIEAFSVSKTIVATRVDGTPEIVVDNENGLLVEPRNSKEIAEKILEIIKDKNKKKRFEKNALDTYKREFSFEKLKKKYLDFYKNL